MKSRRQCIRIPNGILCTSGELSEKDAKAVREFSAQIRAARLKSLDPATPSVVIDPRKPKTKDPTLNWQKVHSGDPKRHIYRERLKTATGADRVSAMATTPSGLMLSGRCSRVTKKNGLLQVIGVFQVTAP